MMIKTPFLNKQVLAVHPRQVLANTKRDDVKANIKALWCMPYDADPLLEPEYVGLTYGQVVLMKQVQLAARGDGSSVDRILDRMIGKPEQINKNLNIQGTYAEFMEQVAQAEGIIDVDPTTATSDQQEI